MVRFGLELIHHISNCYLIDFTIKLRTLNGSVIITNDGYIGYLAHRGLVVHISAGDWVITGSVKSMSPVS